MGCAASSEGQGPTPEAKQETRTVPASFQPNRDDSGRGSIAFQACELVSTRGSAADGIRKSAVFDTPSIGTCTKHGTAPVRGSRTGQAKINQDRGVVCWPYNGSTGQALFAIFDGHGKQGEKVSEFCMTTIPKLLESQPSLASADAVPAALHTTIVECDRQLMEGDLQGVARTAGTTSTVCYLRGNEIWVACSGDSRAVLCSLPGDHIAATDMSKDFKPELPEERARIEALGGEVTVSGPRGLPPAP